MFDNLSATDVIIFDALAAGLQIQAGDIQDELDIKNQPSGIYYVRLKFKDGLVTKKMVKL